jgi:hypothetical protein
LPLILNGDFPPSGQTLPQRATELRQESSARQKRARLIFENGCFSLERWHTPRARECGEKSETFVKRNGDRGGHCFSGLTAQVEAPLFPTPVAAQTRQGLNYPDGRRGQTLIGAARGQNWPTAKARDFHTEGRGQFSPSLPAALSQDWSTPTTAIATGGQTSRSGKRKGELLLAGQAAWATPKASLNGPDYARANREKSGADDLVTQAAKNWGTPSAHDCKGKGMDGQLVTDLLFGRGPQGAERNNTHGKPPGSLNPAWVEQLMGWATGMSSFTCSETEWRRWLRQWRSWLFGKKLNGSG